MTSNRSSRFVPLGAANQLSYTMRFVGGVFSLRAEAAYWRKRLARGDAYLIGDGIGLTVDEPHPRRQKRRQHA